MKRIKKTGSQSPRRPDHRERVSQPALFEEGQAAEKEDSSPTGSSGNAGGGVSAYARVSSGQQEKEETVTSQMAAIEAYARAHKLDLRPQDMYVDEGWSGKVLRRPGLDKLLDRVYEGDYEQVLILDPSRLARDFGHQILMLEEFERGGCRAVFIQRPIGEGPDEQMLLQMQGVIAQYEHAKIQERTRRGKLHRMRRGELVNGQRVFGYQYVPRKGERPAHYRIIEAEAEVVRRIFEWYVRERTSLRAISQRLQQEAVPTVRGGRWDGSHIGHMLSNPIYIGTGYANKTEAVEPKRKSGRASYRKYLKSARRARPREEWFAFPAPAIVEEELFELARQSLERNRELAARRTKHDYLLRGMIRCDCCGYKMYADTQSRSYVCGMSRNAYARERSREACENKRRLPVGQLDQLVWNEVVDLLRKPSLLKRHYPQLRDKLHPQALGGSLEKLDARIEKVRGQIARLNDLFIQGIVDPPSHRSKYDEFSENLRRLQTQRNKAAADHLDQKEVSQLLRSFRSFAATIKGRLDTADFSSRRGIVEQMVNCVIIGKSVITIEHTAPCKKNTLCGNLEL